ncbi:Na+-driven multidrug efflux pump [Carnobacterium iners]|uniref:Na+-driven multidrug efflux pump n=1 Tax=Carnobacterium iners TaxID=1073423 RepID=A0A1X7NA54_9LACT|nr:hypothetical protein [Carnobacterium iners]SEL07449.1 Na+-driven multidrug efflux pump [Carnobacterium iners]SMH33943.1 Na+-driven multidrug efflux pump [Carnobacterium iners]
MKKKLSVKNKILENENNRNIMVNVLGAFMIKGGGLIVSLFAMPSYISYFNNQTVLGLWFTMLSVLTWILTFDLGIGNGLRNHLVPAFIKKDKQSIRKLISSAYIVIGMMMLVILILAIPIFNFINWNKLFNISEKLIDSKILLLSVTIVFSGIMLHFLLKIINSILYALQKSAINNFIGLLNSIIILAYLLLAPSADLPTSLLRLSIVNVVAINVPLLVATIYVFSKELKFSKPKLSFYRKEYATKILKLGGLFFWVQIMYMLITTTNEFLITWLSIPAEVVEYSIYYKLFTLVGIIFALALTPIWSAVTKALSENNINWIKKLYRLLIYLTLIAVAFEFILILFLQPGINIWLGSNAIKVNYYYAFTFAIFGGIFIWNGVLSSIANGLGELRVQALCYTVGAFLKFPIAWVLVHYLDSWIGIIIANIIAMGLYSIIQPFWLNRILKNKIGGQNNV